MEQRQGIPGVSCLNPCSTEFGSIIKYLLFYATKLGQLVMWQWVTVTRNQFSGIDGDTVTFANQSLNALANKPVGLVGVFFL